MQVPSKRLRLLVPSPFPTHPHNILTIQRLHPHSSQGCEARTGQSIVTTQRHVSGGQRNSRENLRIARTSNAWVTALQTNALMYNVYDRGFGPTRGHRHVTLTSNLSCQRLIYIPRSLIHLLSFHTNSAILPSRYFTTT
jgi:hypothetical protein